MSAVERILEDLASGNAETSEDAARKEERLARRFYRNGAEKRIRAAHAATNRIETTHIARVARLLGTPRGAEIDKDDPAVVEREWAALPKPPKRGLPKVTLTVVLAIGIVPFLAFFLHLALRPYDPTRAGVGRALSQNVGTYVGDVTRGGRSGPEGAMRKVFPIERPALGDAGTLAFERFFGEYEAAADDSKNMGKLYVETRNVNRALQNRGLPFFLDTKLWMPKQPIIYAYYIE